MNFNDFAIHPTKILVRVARGEVLLRPARIGMDKFDALIAKTNAEFGDTTKPVTGPGLPKVEPKVKGRR